MDAERRGGSEPCFVSDVIGGNVVDRQVWTDVERFRRAERERLYQTRKAHRSGKREALTRAVMQDLDSAVGRIDGRRIAVYWPIRGEPDLRPWMTRANDAGAQIALPVVIEKGQPLEFRRWWPGCPMDRGIWNIPVPSEGETVMPELVVAPLVGVDNALYRLGNGGGYYDMTLAAMNPLPRVIGVGYPDCTIPTIYPMPWDIPMEAVVLGDGAPRIRNVDDG